MPWRIKFAMVGEDLTSDALLECDAGVLDEMVDDTDGELVDVVVREVAVVDETAEDCKRTCVVALESCMA